VLQVDEAGSMYFILYGYMNRGNYEGKTGVVLYSYDGQQKLVEEVGFWESTESASYVMQEVEKLSYFSGGEKFYCCMDGNVISFDLKEGTTVVEIPYASDNKIYISENHSCFVLASDGAVSFWNLENGTVRNVITTVNKKIIPQGFIGNDFVYGIYDKEDGILQSDGTYAEYMREIHIEDASGKVLKKYTVEGIWISDCTIVGNQVILDRVVLSNGMVEAASRDQIIASKGGNNNTNYIQSAMTENYQTIKQVSLKNKMDLDSLERVEAKEVFYEGSRSIDVRTESQAAYYKVYSPWRINEYVTDAGEAVRKASLAEGYARDHMGAIVWKKEASSVKNQIMAIELEEASAQKSSKNVCLDIVLRQMGNPIETADLLVENKTCQEILALAPEEYQWMDITGCSLESMLYYIDRDIPVMVLYDTGEAILITGFNQFNIVVMDPVARKLGYMSRSDAKAMLESTNNQVFTYYHQKVN
jgi:hypothetical protein